RRAREPSARTVQGGRDGAHHTHHRAEGRDDQSSKQRLPTGDRFGSRRVHLGRSRGHVCALWSDGPPPSRLADRTTRPDPPARGGLRRAQLPAMSVAARTGVVSRETRRTGRPPTIAVLLPQLLEWNTHHLTPMEPLLP